MKERLYVILCVVLAISSYALYAQAAEVAEESGRLSNEVWIALISMVGSLVLAYFGLVAKLKEIHTTFNSKMDKMLALTEEKGKLIGRDQERASVAQAKKLTDKDKQ